MFSDSAAKLRPAAAGRGRVLVGERFDECVANDCGGACGRLSRRMRYVAAGQRFQPPATVMQPQSTEPPPGNGPQFASDGVVKVAYADFNHSAFPYRGMIPPDDDHSKPRPFLDVNENGRLAHSSQRGGVLYEDKTFNDRRVLIAASKDFDPNQPAALIVLFHGNQGILARDVVGRQQAPRQVAESSLNAVLLAPQLAVDANEFERRQLLAPRRLRRIPQRSRRQARPALSASVSRDIPKHACRHRRL